MTDADIDYIQAELRATQQRWQTKWGQTPPSTGAVHWRNAWDRLNQLRTTTVDPPQGVITVIGDTDGIGRNIVQPESIHDLKIGATGDSGVIVEKTAPGSIMTRVEIAAACALPGPGWARHGFYIAAPAFTLTNAKVKVIPGVQVGQCFSIRCGGTHISSFQADGAPHVVGYFEQDDQPGDVVVENGTGSFTDDCAVWLDGSMVGRGFVFANCHFTGNGEFVKKGAAFQGVVELDGCTLNGKPV